jgi:hypothetical protein|tara:strand:- start:4332 stop:4694 length:363 start_codon:yes stop_codon:yes gene_type:complete
MSSLPIPAQTTDKKITQLFNNYFTKTLSFGSNEVDAVVGFFESRNFGNAAAISTATVILNQAKLDNVKVFELLDTLKGLNELQLSAVVTEVLNYNRLRTSVLGYKITEPTEQIERRNIVV